MQRQQELLQFRRLRRAGQRLWRTEFVDAQLFANSYRAGGAPLSLDEKADAPKSLVERAAARYVAWRQRR
jgi:hypothetical protein